MLVVTQDTCRPISPGASAAAMGEVYAPDAPNGRTKCGARSNLGEPGKPTQVEKGPNLSSARTVDIQKKIRVCPFAEQFLLEIP